MRAYEVLGKLLLKTYDITGLLWHLDKPEPVPPSERNTLGVLSRTLLSKHSGF